MSVDLSKIKPGDEVLVRATVHAIEHGGVSIVYTDAEGGRVPNVIFALEEIAGHTRRAPSVGDRVRPSHWREPNVSQDTGTVRAIDGDLAWIKWGKQLLYNTEFPLSQLERVDE